MCDDIITCEMATIPKLETFRHKLAPFISSFANESIPLHKDVELFDGWMNAIDNPANGYPGEMVSSANAFVPTTTVPWPHTSYHDARTVPWRIAYRPCARAASHVDYFRVFFLNECARALLTRSRVLPDHYAADKKAAMLVLKYAMDIAVANAPNELDTDAIFLTILDPAAPFYRAFDRPTNRYADDDAVAVTAAQGTRGAVTAANNAGPAVAAAPASPMVDGTAEDTDAAIALMRTLRPGSMVDYFAAAGDAASAALGLVGWSTVRVRCISPTGTEAEIEGAEAGGKVCSVWVCFDSEGGAEARRWAAAGSRSQVARAASEAVATAAANARAILRRDITAARAVQGSGGGVASGLWRAGLAVGSFVDAADATTGEWWQAAVVDVRPADAHAVASARALLLTEDASAADGTRGPVVLTPADEAVLVSLAAEVRVVFLGRGQRASEWRPRYAPSLAFLNAQSDGRRGDVAPLPFTPECMRAPAPRAARRRAQEDASAEQAAVVRGESTAGPLKGPMFVSLVQLGSRAWAAILKRLSKEAAVAAARSTKATAHASTGTVPTPSSSVEAAAAARAFTYVYQMTVTWSRCVDVLTSTSKQAFVQQMVKHVWRYIELMGEDDVRGIAGKDALDELIAALRVLLSSTDTGMPGVVPQAGLSSPAYAGDMAQATLALRCLKSSQIMRRRDGMRLLAELAFASRVGARLPGGVLPRPPAADRTRSADSLTEETTEFALLPVAAMPPLDLAKYIISKGVIVDAFGTRHHRELLRVSGDVLHLLGEASAFGSPELGALWGALCRSDADDVDAAVAVLHDVRSELPPGAWHALLDAMGLVPGEDLPAAPATAAFRALVPADALGLAAVSAASLTGVRLLAAAATCGLPTHAWGFPLPTTPASDADAVAHASAASIAVARRALSALFCLALGAPAAVSTASPTAAVAAAAMSALCASLADTRARRWRPALMRACVQLLARHASCAPRALSLLSSLLHAYPVGDTPAAQALGDSPSLRAARSYGEAVGALQAAHDVIGVSLAHLRVVCAAARSRARDMDVPTWAAVTRGQVGGAVAHTIDASIAEATATLDQLDLTLSDLDAACASVAQPVATPSLHRRGNISGGVTAAAATGGEEVVMATSINVDGDADSDYDALGPAGRALLDSRGAICSADTVTTLGSAVAGVLDFLGAALTRSAALFLTRQQVEALWDECVANAVTLTQRSLALGWCAQALERLMAARGCTLTQAVADHFSRLQLRSNSTSGSGGGISSFGMDGVVAGMAGYLVSSDTTNTTRATPSANSIAQSGLQSRQASQHAVAAGVIFEPDTAVALFTDRMVGPNAADFIAAAASDADAFNTLRLFFLYVNGLAGRLALQAHAIAARGRFGVSPGDGDTVQPHDFGMLAPALSSLSLSTASTSSTPSFTVTTTEPLLGLEVIWDVAMTATSQTGTNAPSAANRSVSDVAADSSALLTTLQFALGPALSSRAGDLRRSYVRRLTERMADDVAALGIVGKRAPARTVNALAADSNVVERAVDARLQRCVALLEALLDAASPEDFDVRCALRSTIADAHALRQGASGPAWDTVTAALSITAPLGQALVAARRAFASSECHAPDYCDVLDGLVDDSPVVCAPSPALMGSMSGLSLATGASAAPSDASGRRHCTPTLASGDIILRCSFVLRRPTSASPDSGDGAPLASSSVALGTGDADAVMAPVPPDSAAKPTLGAEPPPTDVTASDVRMRFSCRESVGDLISVLSTLAALPPAALQFRVASGLAGRGGTGLLQPLSDPSALGRTLEQVGLRDGALIVITLAAAAASPSMYDSFRTAQSPSGGDPDAIVTDDDDASFHSTHLIVTPRGRSVDNDLAQLQRGVDAALARYAGLPSTLLASDDRAVALLHAVVDAAASSSSRNTDTPRTTSSTDVPAPSAAAAAAAWRLLCRLPTSASPASLGASTEDAAFVTASTLLVDEGQSGAAPGLKSPSRFLYAALALRRLLLQSEGIDGGSLMGPAPPRARLEEPFEAAVARITNAADKATSLTALKTRHAARREWLHRSRSGGSSTNGQALDAAAGFASGAPSSSAAPASLPWLDEATWARMTDSQLRLLLRPLVRSQLGQQPQTPVLPLARLSAVVQQRLEVAASQAGSGGVLGRRLAIASDELLLHTVRRFACASVGLDTAASNSADASGAACAKREKERPLSALLRIAVGDDAPLPSQCRTQLPPLPSMLHAPSIAAAALRYAHDAACASPPAWTPEAATSTQRATDRGSRLAESLLQGALQLWLLACAVDQSAWDACVAMPLPSDSSRPSRSTAASTAIASPPLDAPVLASPRATPAPVSGGPATALRPAPPPMKRKLLPAALGTLLLHASSAGPARGTGRMDASLTSGGDDVSTRVRAFAAGIFYAAAHALIWDGPHRAAASSRTPLNVLTWHVLALRPTATLARGASHDGEDDGDVVVAASTGTTLATPASSQSELVGRMSSDARGAISASAAAVSSTYYALADALLRDWLVRDTADPRTEDKRMGSDLARTLVAELRRAPVVESRSSARSSRAVLDSLLSAPVSSAVAAVTAPTAAAEVLAAQYGFWARTLPANPAGATRELLTARRQAVTTATARYTIPSMHAAFVRTLVEDVTLGVPTSNDTLRYGGGGTLTSGSVERKLSDALHDDGDASTVAIAMSLSDFMVGSNAAAATPEFVATTAGIAHVAGAPQPVEGEVTLALPGVDYVATGTLRLLTTLVEADAELGALLGAPQRSPRITAAISPHLYAGKDLVRFLYDDCLFGWSSATMTDVAGADSGTDLVVVAPDDDDASDARLPRLKSPLARRAALSLLSSLARCSSVNARIAGALVARDARQHYDRGANEPGLAAWALSSASWVDRAGSGANGYVGLRNLGCICYMNALMQQFFMIEPLRYGVLAAPLPPTAAPTAAVPGTAPQPPAAPLEEGLLYQLQRMFGFLELSHRRAYDPSGWCVAFKDPNGAPTPTWMQQDAHEYLTTLLDRLEGALSSSGSPVAAGLVRRVLGLEVRETKACTGGCARGARGSSEVQQWLTVEVTRPGGLLGSLEALIAPEDIPDYACDNCGRRTTLRKHTRLGAPPHSLLVHLKRFEMNYETGGTSKLNNRFEFPAVLDLWPYSADAAAVGAVDGPPLPGLPREAYIFDLCGIVVHMGSLESGHYYSLIRERGARAVERAAARGTPPAWLEFNDAVVSEFDPDRIPGECFGSDPVSVGFETVATPSIRTAYMLVYDRRLQRLPAVAGAGAVGAADAAVPPPSPTQTAAALRRDAPAEAGEGAPKRQRTDDGSCSGSEDGVAGADSAASSSRGLQARSSARGGIPRAIAVAVDADNAAFDRTVAMLDGGDVAGAFHTIADALSRLPAAIAADTAASDTLVVSDDAPPLHDAAPPGAIAAWTAFGSQLSAVTNAATSSSPSSNTPRQTTQVSRHSHTAELLAEFGAPSAAAAALGLYALYPLALSTAGAAILPHFSYTVCRLLAAVGPRAANALLAYLITPAQGALAAQRRRAAALASGASPAPPLLNLLSEALLVAHAPIVRASAARMLAAALTLSVAGTPNGLDFFVRAPPPLQPDSPIWVVAPAPTEPRYAALLLEAVFSHSFFDISLAPAAREWEPLFGALYDAARAGFGSGLPLSLPASSVGWVAGGVAAATAELRAWVAGEEVPGSFATTTTTGPQRHLRSTSRSIRHFLVARRAPELIYDIYMGDESPWRDEVLVGNARPPRTKSRLGVRLAKTHPVWPSWVRALDLAVLLSRSTFLSLALRAEKTLTSVPPHTTVVEGAVPRALHAAVRACVPVVKTPSAGVADALQPHARAEAQQETARAGNAAASFVPLPATALLPDALAADAAWMARSAARLDSERARLQEVQAHIAARGTYTSAERKVFNSVDQYLRETQLADVRESLAEGAPQRLWPAHDQVTVREVTAGALYTAPLAYPSPQVGNLPTSALIDDDVMRAFVLSATGLARDGRLAVISPSFATPEVSDGCGPNPGAVAALVAHFVWGDRESSKTVVEALRVAMENRHPGGARNYRAALVIAEALVLPTGDALRADRFQQLMKAAVLAVSNLYRAAGYRSHETTLEFASAAVRWAVHCPREGAVFLALPIDSSMSVHHFLEIVLSHFERDPAAGWGLAPVAQATAIASSDTRVELVGVNCAAVAASDDAAVRAAAPLSALIAEPLLHPVAEYYLIDSAIPPLSLSLRATVALTRLRRVCDAASIRTSAIAPFERGVAEKAAAQQVVSDRPATEA